MFLWLHSWNCVYNAMFLWCQRREKDFLRIVFTMPCFCGSIVFTIYNKAMAASLCRNLKHAFDFHCFLTFNLIYNLVHIQQQLQLVLYVLCCRTCVPAYAYHAKFKKAFCIYYLLFYIHVCIEFIIVC